MEPPPQFVQWLRQSYPKPSIDEVCFILVACAFDFYPLQNWLSQCYAWVVEEHDLNPATAMDRIKEQVESQLLMSDLTDSMVHGSGLPHNIAGLQKGVLSGPPVLVQITALTDIGHSAFSLMNVHQTKVDRADLAGLAQGDNEDEADEGPVPNYPRSMLKLELSDGAMRLNAIEYRKIPQLDLENTPLGFKVRLS
jgi:RecQ-mediated genome instability protein 1